MTSQLDEWKNLYLGQWVYEEGDEKTESRPGRNEVDFCPFCKRNFHPLERPFNLKTDNHLDRCVRGCYRG